LTCIQFSVSSHTGIGIGIGIGQYYWVLGDLFGIVLTLNSTANFNQILTQITCSDDVQSNRRMLNVKTLSYNGHVFTATS